MELLAQSCSSLVCHLDSLDVGARLGVDPVECLVLSDQRGVHVISHVTNVAHHSAHLSECISFISFCKSCYLLHVLLHLLLPVITEDLCHEGPFP